METTLLDRLAITAIAKYFKFKLLLYTAGPATHYAVVRFLPIAAAPVVRIAGAVSAATGV